jgi:hypothetical protein
MTNCKYLDAFKNDIEAERYAIFHVYTAILLEKTHEIYFQKVWPLRTAEIIQQ